MPLEDPFKISRLKIVNRSDETRQLSITHYVEWVLGNQRSRTAPFIITEIDRQTSALLARNPWSTDFQSRVAFMDMGGRQQALDRRSRRIHRPSWFAGRAGGAARRRRGSSNRVGGGLDPCGAMQCRFSLRPGEEAEFVLLSRTGGIEGAAPWL